MCDCECLNCLPEITGRSDSPVSEFTNQKFFAAGNTYSSSAVYSEDIELTKETVGSLSVKYGFDVVPLTEAVILAGYTESLRLNATCWFGASADKDNFYYLASSGSGLPPIASSFLVCRKRSDGQLIYAKNTEDYRLDTANNFMNNNKIFCRMTPVIFEDTIYIGGSFISNIGPQVFAVNKFDGTPKWSLAYNPPPGAPPTISTPGNYIQFQGSNVRINNLNLIVKRFPGSQYPTIIAGVSSYQNLGLDVGTFSGKFPKYTDQGFLFLLEDRGTEGVKVSQLPTCAPILFPGDLMSSTGPDSHNPFLPGLNYTVIATSTTDQGGIIAPYSFVDNDVHLPLPKSPAANNTSPVSALIRFTSTTPINISLFVQAVWGIPGLSIYQDADRVTAYTPSSLIILWIGEQVTLPPGVTRTHMIWSYLNQAQLATAMAQSGNGGLFYFKVINDNTTVQNEFDANGINFFGNDPWAAPVSVDGNKIFFGTGQAHSTPFFDLYSFSTPERDFGLRKIPLVAAQNNYVNGTGTLGQVNNELDKFLTDMKDLSINAVRSPRARMSYSNSIICAEYNNGNLTLSFAARSVPSDNWSVVDRISTLVGPVNGIDGDASSGIQVFNTGRKKVATATKGGIGMVIDIENLNDNVVFNGTNLDQKGVFVSSYQYLGSNSTAGGSNYQCGQSSGNRLYSCQINTPLVYPTVPPMSEIYMDRNGVIIPSGKSYISSFNIDTGAVEWNTPLQAIASAQVSVVNAVVLAADTVGKFYGLDGLTGEILWILDNSKGQFPTHGGIASPFIGKNIVIWLANYKIPGAPGSGSKHGIALKVDHNNVIKDKCNKNFNFLVDNIYNYSDTTSSIEMRWYNENNEIRIKVTYISGSTEYITRFRLEIQDPPQVDVLVPCEDRQKKVVFAMISGDIEIEALDTLNVFSKVSYVIFVKINGIRQEYIFTQ